MYKTVHLVIFLMLNCSALVALGGEKSSEILKVAIEDASAGSKVIGVETYYGLIVAAQKIQNVEKPKNVKVREIKNSEILVLKNGRLIEVRDVEYLYVKQDHTAIQLQNVQGKHPNTDEGASGTH